MVTVLILFLSVIAEAKAVEYEEIARPQSPPLLALDSADEKYIQSPIQKRRPIDRALKIQQNAAAYCASQKLNSVVWYETYELKEASPESSLLAEVSTTSSVAELTSILDEQTLISSSMSNAQRLEESLGADLREPFRAVQIPLLSVDGRAGKVWKPSVFSLLWCSNKVDKDLTRPLTSESSFDDIHAYLIRNRVELSPELSEALLFRAVKKHLNLYQPDDFILAIQMHHTYPHSVEYERKMKKFFPKTFKSFKRLAELYGNASLLDSYLPQASRMSVYGYRRNVNEVFGALLESRIVSILEKAPSRNEIFQFISYPFVEKILTQFTREKISRYLTQAKVSSFEERLEVLSICSLIVKEGYWSQYQGWKELITEQVNLGYLGCQSQEEFWMLVDAAAPALDQCACRYHSSPTLLHTQKLLQNGLDRFSETEEAFLQFLENAKTRDPNLKHLKVIVEPKLDRYLARFNFTEAQLGRLQSVFPKNKCLQPGHLKLTGYLKCIASELSEESVWRSELPSRRGESVWQSELPSIRGEPVSNTSEGYSYFGV